jgi:hypothetical protein
MQNNVIHQLRFDVKKYGSAGVSGGETLNVFEDLVFEPETFEFNN